MSKKISEILPKTEILTQLVEEASELAQVALKLRRALDGTNPTPKRVLRSAGAHLKKSTQTL